MNTLDKYISEKLFDTNSIEDQIEEQYYFALVKELQIKLLDIFESRKNNYLIFKNGELTIDSKNIENIIVNDTLFELIEEYFSKFKKVSFSQPDVTLNVISSITIDCDINKQRAEIFNKFFENACFKHMDIFGSVDGLTINYGINDQKGTWPVSSCASFYFYTDKIKSLNINVVSLKYNDKDYQIFNDAYTIEDMKNINYTFANSNVENKFKKLKKTINIKKCRKEIGITIEKYLETQDNTLYKSINNFIHNMLKNINFFDDNTQVDIILYSDKNDKIILNKKRNKLLLTCLINDDPIIIEFPY